MSREELILKNYDNIWCIDEENYAEDMESIVEECLGKVRKTGYVNSEKDKDIYYEMFENENPKGNIVISHGFTESGEKFKEMAYYFFVAGYSVFVIDHRGHGRSYRKVANYSVTHIEDFEDYTKDLKALVEKIVKPHSNGKPLYLYAHSMGGAIATLYAENYPEDFSKVVLSSPMLSINFGGYPAWIGTLIAKVAVLFGKKEKKMFVHQEFNPNEKFEDSSAGSRARFQWYLSKRIKTKEFQNYAGTYSWLLQSIYGLKKIFLRENLKKIKVPILLFQAQNDTVVTSEGQDKLEKEVNMVRLVKVNGSKHEIYMQSNNILNPYLHEIFKFLEN